MEVSLQERERWQAATAARFPTLIRPGVALEEVEAWLRRTDCLSDEGPIEVSADGEAWEALGPAAELATVERLVDVAGCETGVWFRGRPRAVRMGVLHRIWFLQTRLEMRFPGGERMAVLDTGELSIRSGGVASKVQADDPELLVAHVRALGGVEQRDGLYKVPQGGGYAGEYDDEHFAGLSFAEQIGDRPQTRPMPLVDEDEWLRDEVAE